MHIALLSTSARVALPDLALIARACELQLARHVAPAWGLAPIGVSAHVSPSLIPPGSYVIRVQDQPDEPDALGYHADAGGTPYGRVFVAPVLAAGGGILSDPSPGGFSCSVSAVTSHEVIELVLDPATNRWVDGPARAEGSQYALEGCDAVEGSLYAIDAGIAGHPRQVLVSDFVFPAAFDPLTPRGARLDQLGVLKAPFTVAKYGYMIVRAAPGTEHLVFGAGYPAWRRAVKTQAGSRTHRRACVEERATDEVEVEVKVTFE